MEKGKENPYHLERRRAFTDADISALVDEMESRKLPYACRYDIEPEDMSKLMSFVRTFHDGVVDYRSGVRKFVIRIFVWGTVASMFYFLSDYLPFLKPLFKHLKEGGAGR